MNCCDDCPVATACAVSSDFEELWYEAENNGNLNWICFPESAERFRVIARRLLDVARLFFCPEEFGDDDDAICLLMGMLDQPPQALPCSADAEYQALRLSLVRLNLISDL